MFDQQATRAKAVVFDLGGVLIDLRSSQARRELIDDFGMPAKRFDQLTRSCFTMSRRSITELAMIGRVDTSIYLARFLRELAGKTREASEPTVCQYSDESARKFSLSRTSSGEVASFAASSAILLLFTGISCVRGESTRPWAPSIMCSRRI